ncbi:hypothetical protein PABG_11290 [Paracoccidioides brasiliensis Pb03]|nr:hypothetical protein PABG_11290 [Paracoccidioides brasiliensis Pb03]
MRDEAEEWLVAVVEECAGNDDSSPPPPPLLITPDLSKLSSIDTTRGYPREDEWIGDHYDCALKLQCKRVWENNVTHHKFYSRMTNSGCTKKEKRQGFLTS